MPAITQFARFKSDNAEEMLSAEVRRDAAVHDVEDEHRLPLAVAGPKQLAHVLVSEVTQPPIFLV
jgi:hypothetical protein